jgi:hypothetical protein
MAVILGIRKHLPLKQRDLIIGNQLFSKCIKWDIYCLLSNKTVTTFKNTALKVRGTNQK